MFDGASLVFDANGACVARVAQFVEAVAVVDVDVMPVFRKRLLDPRGRAMADDLPVLQVSGTRADHEGEARPVPEQPLARTREMYEALVLGTRDYVEKNGFTDVVVALSGGIDSSLVTVIAADAVGAERVHAVALPSRYSSEGSITDAELLCTNLGVELRTIPIEPAFAAMLGDAGAVVRRARTRTSPRRTCRAASAPRC